MTYKDFRDNKEIGRLIRFAYDLHKRDFTLLPCLPYFEFYTGHGLYYGKIFKDGGVYGDIFFDNHSNLDALISLVVMKELDSSHQYPKSALFIQTSSIPAMRISKRKWRFPSRLANWSGGFMTLSISNIRTRRANGRRRA